jgi:general secretion pathway protein C
MVGWFRIGVNLILLAVGAHLAASLAVRRRVEGLSVGSVVAGSEPSDAALAVVKQRDLFHTRVGEQPPPRRPAAPPAPKSAGSSFVLKGTVVGQGQDPMAVLAAGHSPVLRFYHVGDRIDGAEIREIRREKVVLRINGRDQELALDKSSPSTRPEPSPQPTREAIVSAPADTDALAEASPAASDDTEKPDTAEKPPDELPSGGIVVGDITPGSLLDHAGMEAGDVITAVDDEPVTSLEEAVERLTGHDDATPIRIEVRRRGRIETLMLHPGQQEQ